VCQNRVPNCAELEALERGALRVLIGLLVGTDYRLLCLPAA
jgi:butyrate kinase